MMSPLDMTYNNMKAEGRKTIGFGKYYQLTFEEVYTRDYQYCKWCLSLTPRNFSMYDFQTYINKMNILR